MTNNIRPLHLKDIEYNEIEDIYEHHATYNKEKTYLVMAQDRINRRDWTCTCPHFMYRCADNGKECKHITRIRFIDELWRKIDKQCPQNKELLP